MTKLGLPRRLETQKINRLGGGVGAGLPPPPNGFVYLLGAGGVYLLGADGAYLLGVAP